MNTHGPTAIQPASSVTGKSCFSSTHDDQSLNSCNAGTVHLDVEESFGPGGEELGTRDVACTPIICVKTGPNRTAEDVN